MRRCLDWWLCCWFAFCVAFGWCWVAFGADVWFVVVVCGCVWSSFGLYLDCVLVASGFVFCFAVWVEFGLRFGLGLG